MELITAQLCEAFSPSGAGYVLSRKAVTKFVEEGLPNAKLCKDSWHGAEDAEMGRFLENIGVKAGDSRDAMGRHRFLPFSLCLHATSSVNRSQPDWFYQYMYYPYMQVSR